MSPDTSQARATLRPRHSIPRPPPARFREPRVARLHRRMRTERDAQTPAAPPRATASSSTTPWCRGRPNARPLSRAPERRRNTVNISVVYLSNNPIQHWRTKHTELGIHFVREHVALGDFGVLHVLMHQQFANVMTKGPPTDVFAEICSSLCVSPLNAQTAGVLAICIAYVLLGVEFCIGKGK